MDTIALPPGIQNLRDNLVEQGFEDTWNTLLDADQELTRSLTCSDTCDFVVLDSGGVWLFCHNEQLDEWDISFAGKPQYEIDAAMIGDTEIDVEEFAAAVQYELRGVKVVAITAVNGARNHLSSFYQMFQDKLDKAFQVALENL